MFLALILFGFCPALAAELDFNVEKALENVAYERQENALAETSDSIWDSLSADESYTLSLDKDVLTASTVEASSYRDFLRFPVSLKEKRTYKVSFQLRVVSHGGGKNTKAYVNPCWTFDGIGSIASQDGKNHIAPGKNLGISDTFTTCETELTVDSLDSRSDGIFRLYTNPVKYRNQTVTAPTYEIRELSFHERCDIIYEAGKNCVLAENATELPITVGAYRDEAAGKTIYVSLASMPYTVKDARWSIDPEKPWVDQNGNEYASGDPVELSDLEGALVLTPNLKTVYTVHTVQFATEGLVSFPESIQGIDGDVWRFTDAAEAVAQEEGMRFCGWTTEKDGKQAVTQLVITEDTVLYPILSPNYDFAYSDAYDGTFLTGAELVKKKDGTMVGAENVESDAFCVLGRLRLSTAQYRGIRILFDAYSSPEVKERFVPAFASEFEGVYINTGISQNADGQTKLLTGDELCTAELVEENGKVYLALTIEACKSEYWTGILQYMRIDPYAVGGDFALRRIEFVPFEEFEEKSVVLSGFKAPKTGEGATAKSQLICEGDWAQVTDIHWTPALLPGNVFDSETEYTAELTIYPNRVLGKLFAEGTTVILNGKEHLPVKKEDGALTVTLSFEKTEYRKKHTVTFDTQGLRADSVPNGITAFEGTLFRVSAYNTAISAEDTLRFNGWAWNKGETDWRKAVDTVLCEGDITLYPILSYDMNFSCSANWQGWTFHDAVGSFTVDGYMLVTQTGANTDVMAIKSGLSIRTALFTGIRIYYHVEVFNPTLDVIYFCRAGEGASVERYLRGKDCGIDPETGYHLVEYSAEGVANWNGILNMIRFDLFAAPGSTAVKAICFEYPEVLDTAGIVVSGVQTPEEGRKDFSTLTVYESSDYDCTFDHIEWSPALKNGRFDENTEYTATVCFAPKSGFRFDSARALTMTLGEIVSAASIGTDGKLYADFRFEKTGSYLPFSLTIEGEKSFFVDGKVRTYSAHFDTDIPDKGVEWTVSDPEVFSIDADGKLHMLKNAERTIVLRATSLYNPAVYAEMEIQTQLYKFSFEISGPECIPVANRTVPYSIRLTEGEIYDTSVTWKVDGDSATIHATSGRLTPRKNGTVLLTAVSNYDPEVYATLSVTLENQGELYRLSFNPGTTDRVENMPQEKRERGVVFVEELEAPRREGYIFLGWAENDESFLPISSVNVSKDTELYAVWGKGTLYTFGKKGNMKVDGVQEGDDYIEAVCGGYGYWRLPIQSLSLDPEQVQSVVVRASYSAPTFTRVYYKSKYTNANGQQVSIGYNTDSYQYAEKQGQSADVQGKGLNEFESMLHNMTSDHVSDSPGYWPKADMITELYIDICKNIGVTARLKYIALLDTRRMLTFDTGTEDAVSGMPEARTVLQGEMVTITEKPTRSGYQFMGWSKELTKCDTPKNTFGVVENLTLYAVWNRVIDCTSAQGTPLSSVAIGDVNIQKDGNALLIRLKNKSVSPVTLIYTGAQGKKTVTVKSLENGYAVISLKEMQMVSGAQLEVGGENAFASVVVTSLEYALQKQNDVAQSKPGSNASASVVRPTVTVENTNTVYELDKKEEADEDEPVIEENERFKQMVFGRIPFTDVKTAHWFRNEVVTAYRLGLIRGKTKDTFEPFGDVSVAEAITLAVRLHYSYHGYDETKLASEAVGTAWYEPYVRAAKEVGIFSDDLSVEAWEAPALRRQVAVLIKNAVPDEWLYLINKFTSIPDVPKTSSDHIAILRLYNAGVLQGSDSEFHFLPDTPITRAEMAAIVNRVALPESRKRNITEKERLTLVKTYTVQQLFTSASLINCQRDTFELKQNSVYASGATRDPIVFFNDLISGFNGTTVSEIRIALKWDELVLEDPTTRSCRLYFTTAEQPKWLVSNHIDGTWDGTRDENGFAEIVFDCTACEGFQTMIEALRFDPFEAKASFELGRVVMQKKE